MSKLSVFTIADIVKLTNNIKTAYSLLDRLMKKGLAKKIRSNIYSCVNVATGQVLSSRYQIACAVNSSTYLSHHTAFEYHALANQVYYEVYISSGTRFKDFEFEGINYKYVASKFTDGVIVPRNTEGIRVTDLERTVVDSIKDFEKIGGFEELLQCMEGITYLDEEKLIKYLDGYGIQGLYQKAGFILEQYLYDFNISKGFFDYCKSKMGKSTRYLFKETAGEKIYKSEWQLVIPQNLHSITDKGGDILV